MKIIECPRDAMQGVSAFIPTDRKIAYVNQLLKVGFDTIDFGSFVSPRAIPQMKDTREVLDGLQLDESTSKLLAIVANQRGASDAVSFEQVTYLGFPLSVSETFQQRNTNKSIEEALKSIEEIQALCVKNTKVLVVYLSMGFGNPYGDPYSKDLLVSLSGKLQKMGIGIISIADTIGSASVQQIHEIFTTVPREFSDIEFGAHLHSTPHEAAKKIRAIIDSGCERIDSALLGYGGCPMAKDDLTGNIDTKIVISSLQKELDLDIDQFKKAEQIALEIFSQYT